MAQYQIVTLVDITRSLPARQVATGIQRSQQDNFNSLLQAIGLRSNVAWAADPKKHTGALPADIAGKAVHWIWHVDCEREEVFLRDGDPCALLKDDLHGVPVIDQLENSVELTPAAFQTRNGNCNTWVTLL
jgi:hypothetical protein